MFKSVNGGKLPLSMTNYSAGYDVYANEDIEIGAGETKLVPLGIALETQELAQFFETDREFDDFHKQYYLGLYLRSVLGAKGMVLPNGVGIIDMDYKDEIKMIIYNSTSKAFNINREHRIGQLILQRHYGFDILGTNFRKTHTERTGGFGSSGAK